MHSLQVCSGINGSSFFTTLNRCSEVCETISLYFFYLNIKNYTDDSYQRNGVKMFLIKKNPTEPKNGCSTILFYFVCSYHSDSELNNLSPNSGVSHKLLGFHENVIVANILKHYTSMSECSSSSR